MGPEEWMELILVRHGLPERRDDTSDPPLSAAGRDQAQRVARYLADERIDAVFSSTMLRAIQTAEPFAAQSRLEVQTREGIVEFDRGTGAYIPMEELKRDDYAAWQRFAAGEHGTDIVAFQQTVVETLEPIVVAHPGKRVAVFCHGGVVNVWSAHVLGMPPRLFFEPVYASVHRYLCASTGQRNVVSLNERCHLLRPPA
jgi:2,3-bisphosphoglycerate-dependent phosphoglycerate mutase